ncbi:MAG: hypothetical protein LBN27_05855, partial [Prevotellaceae bacterium]|nr:hypothetical protein [Prevotellaceae bacterium]
MARTTDEIKQAIAAEFITQPEVITAYELDTAKSFEEQFSKASLENILFYNTAKSISELENLFDLHKREVNEIIETIIPHRPKWYRDMALKFMIDRVLIDETDKYDTVGMTEDEITAAQIVKYAVAVELNGLLVVKIAIGEAGALQPIEPEQQVQFEAYMNEIRDAGVKLSIINQAGDNFACEMRIFYDAILLQSDVESAAKNAIKNYITGLPFNGEYSNMSLVDAVQAVEGVKVVTFLSAASASNIEDKFTPVAG